MAYQPKSYRKFIAGAAAAAVVLPAAAPAVFAAELTDVIGTRYEEPVKALAEKGIVKGTNEGLFKPYTKITRAEAAVIVARALGLEEAGKEIEENPFKDVREDFFARDAIVALADKGIINGFDAETFGPNENITRGQMAKIIAVAYELELGDGKTDFSDVAETGTFAKYIDAVTENGIAQGYANGAFGISDDILRGDFAVMIYKAENLDKEDPKPVGGTVKAINDTKLEVTFNKAIDADVAAEIEKDGKRFVVFHGGQTANTADIIQSTTISFNENRTKATIILNKAVEADIEYTVALMDGSDNEISSIVETFGPAVLKKGAEKPSLEVNEKQDKFILNFKTKMDASALNLANYELYDDNNNKIGTTLEDIAAKDSDDNVLVDWVDATEKTAVEFKLADGALLAGKTYKVKVGDSVVTDKGDVLSDSQRTITVKTPSIANAQPVAKIARVDGDNIIVTFDKDLAEAKFNPTTITVKTPTGKAVSVTEVVISDTFANALEIVTAGLDKDLTYTIDIPAGGVANKVFHNATNKEVKGLKAVSQANVAVSSVTAQFERQVDNKAQADLLLTFDQRVVPSFDADAIVIKQGTKEYKLQAGAEVELYAGDSTGKTVKVKNVGTAFKNADDKELVLEAGKTYTIELIPGAVQTDATDGKVNQEKLKTTADGLDLSAPAIDKVRIESAEKIVVEFKQDIDAKNLEASDITVLGYEKYRSGNFSDKISLQGSSQLKFSVSGNKLTITPADSSVKFVTEAVDGLVTIKADSIKGKVSTIENAELVSEAADTVDYAAPVIIGGEVVDADTVILTYSEAVQFKGDDEAKQASQFTVENANRDAYGEEADVDGNLIEITFNETNNVFTDTVDLSAVKVIYSKNSTSLVRDALGNEQPSQTLIGLKVSVNK